MKHEAFQKFFWGFLFIMADFRIQGFSILPDIVGYIFLAMGLAIISPYSDFFRKAHKLNIPMIFLSVFSIYERPVQGSGINFGFLGPFGIIIGIASIILSLFVIYNLFMGIKDIANVAEKVNIFNEAEDRWKQYLMLNIATIVGFLLIFMPLLGIVYIIVLLVASIILMVAIMSFMKKCEEAFKGQA